VSIAENNKKVQAISSSVRALYRTIGKIIGKQVYDRICNDNNLAGSLESRKTLADQVILSISQFRRELYGNRDFIKIEEIISNLFDKDSNQAIKQFSWILESYLLLNQSSTASAEVTKPQAIEPDRLLMNRLIEGVRSRILQERDLEKVFSRDFSANLVLTAHPTAGIQPDYINHIKNMVSAVEKMSLRLDPSDWETVSKDPNGGILESAVADIIEDITLSVSHMVRAKPYNEEILTPYNESVNFLANIEEAWNIIPLKLQALEQELKKYLGNNFRVNPKFFRIHSWVARDIDGNPTVSKQIHLNSIFNERIYFLIRYREVVMKLWQNLSDDFTSDPALPTKTFFRDQGFKNLYDEIMARNPQIPHKHQAYRVVIENAILEKINYILDSVPHIQEINSKNFEIFNEFDIEQDLIHPLELIRANKEQVNTKEIDLIIKRANIFGNYGSYGHTRQGADTLALMAKYLTAIYDGRVDQKTNYIFTDDKIPISEDLDPELKQILASSQINKPNYGMLKAKITLQTSSLTEKNRKKLEQTFDLLELSELGAIKRQIISMNTSFEDMLNVLVISKILKSFQPGTQTELPSSRLEIVPLTEQILDLRNSYKVTLAALTNRAWHHYLVAQNGKFIKMRGPSDSGKQNGFMASQWEMFRSKQLDLIVAEIFNAFLKSTLYEDSEQLENWKATLSQLENNTQESLVIKESLEKFAVFFQSADFDKNLWILAKEKLGLDRIRMVNFDGWGEPVERGGGLEFENTVKCTLPVGSIPYYERTLQGGGAQQLASALRTRQAIQDFILGVTEIAVRKFALDKNFESKTLILDPDFSQTMSRSVEILRKSLRSEVFGLELDDDTKVSDEDTLRNYFRHVIKSPLIYLDLFNIASRPTSRSGAQIKELLSDGLYQNNLDLFAEKLPVDQIVKILGDIRAIPYAAMFSLLGGNHVSFYGFNELMNNTEKFATRAGTIRKTCIEWIKHFYHQKNDSQEWRLLTHMISSLEKGIMTADQQCYRRAHAIIEKATNPNYRSGDDLLILKFLKAEQDTLNFIALVKNYRVDNPQKVKLEELMQDNPAERDLLLARRNDAAIPRMGIAISIAKILEHARENNLNPLAAQNIPTELLDLLRKAFAAGASTFGNGCID
jgi:phosphoenolpyruvate carboxylase